MTDVPKYLAEPVEGPITYATLRYQRGYFLIREASPALYQFAKRVFPGCSARGSEVKFRATKRSAGELNWLLLRYPMKIECQREFAEYRDLAVGHALRRDAASEPATAQVPALFSGQLPPFQQEGVNYLVSSRRCLLADEMGLGKTVQALAALAASGAFPALVVCPTSVQRQWQAQTAAFLAGTAAEVVKGQKVYELPPAQVYICHYGLLSHWDEAIRDLGVKAVIFDEVQELRHTGTQKYSAASRLAEHADFVWGLSGTPIYNYGAEIWSVTNVIDYACLGDFGSFTREWCTGYGNPMVADVKALGDYLRQEQLMLRRLKSEVQGQLPPKRRIVVELDHDENVYRKMIGEAVSIANRYASISEWNEKGQALRDMDRIGRQATGVAKVHAAADFVRTLLDAGERVLIYAWHHAVHDGLLERLKDFEVVRITGRDDQDVRADAVEAFAAGKAQAVQLSLRTTAGLDGLQGKASCVVFVELDWSPAIHSQAEDRIHRMGVNPELESVLCYYLVARCGHDEVMQDVLGLKVSQFNGIMGDGGESAADKVLAEQAARDHLIKVVERLRSTHPTEVKTP